MQSSKTSIMAFALAAGLSSGVSLEALSANPAYTYQPKNKRRRGHWAGSKCCKAPSLARAKAKRAKQARKLHR